MTPEDELTVEDYTDQEEERRRRGWLPALVLAIALVVIAWLIWTYSDFGDAPDQPDLGGAASSAVQVPDVTGMTEEAARETLEAAGFSVEVEVSYDSVAEPGTVASQDPKGGSKANKGSTVFISVVEGLGIGQGDDEDAEEDDGLSRVPDVVGMSRSQAASTLRMAGYEMAASELYSESQPEGFVFEQTPQADAVADAGTTVGVLVSLGRAPDANVETPDVMGLSTSEAEQRIRDAGLDPRTMYQPKRSSVGRVYEQSPVPGTVVPAGRLMFILVGTRP